jgi:TRAP transporter TAXI family solute receptor
MSTRGRIAVRLRSASRKDLVLVALPLLLLVIAAFWVASHFIRPAPPPSLTIATGGAGGAYERYGAAYQAVLARYHITLVQRPSAGSIENVELLRAGQVEAAFVQGGTARAEEGDALVSLGGLYYEPLWIFYRTKSTGAAPLTEVTQLKGRRIAIDNPRSGTYALAMDILRANGMDQDTAHLQEIGGLNAAGALAAGTVDAVFIVGSTQSAAVWTLLYTPGVQLMNLSQAEAYARMFPNLTRLTLPRGAIDLVNNVPAQDVSLIAPTASLVVRNDLHPAHIDLLLQAAAEVHNAPGIFQRPGDFPRAVGIDFPVAPEAERYFKSGKPLLQRYLPFWAATLIDRMVVMLIPLVAVLFPVFKFAPAIYGWRIRRRIYRRYGQLKFLEAEVEHHPDPARRDEWLHQLDAIERDVNRLPAPLAFSDMLYTLRGHIAMVRDAILKRETIKSEN